MDKQNESTCCICLENENTLAMFSCHFCNEGIICLECIDPIEGNNENEIIYCPICRSGFFHKRKTDIIKYALNYLTGIKNNNNLITRWIHNYSQTDEYIFFNS
jgi:hypothetical protein